MKKYRGSEKFMLLKKIPGEAQTRLYVAHCSYCGKPFIKVHNRSTLCSYKCKVKSTQDAKAQYQRKRRKDIREGNLIVRDKQQIGTSTVLLSKGIKDDFEEEHLVILREKRRVGILSQ